MTDIFSKEKRSAIMAAIRSYNNKETEIRFIGILRRNRISGWRRKQELEGNPDFVFPLRKLIVFIDGCYWHGCPVHFRLPKSNKAYWRTKIGGNRSRDRRITRHLKREGWRVLRFWQHELADEKKLVKRIDTIKAIKLSIREN